MFAVREIRSPREELIQGSNEPTSRAPVVAREAAVTGENQPGMGPALLVVFPSQETEIGHVFRHDDTHFVLGCREDHGIWLSA